MLLRYRPVGGGDVQDLQLEKSGKAFRGLVPCEAVAKKGKLALWIEAFDRRERVAGQVGSSSAPVEVDIVRELDGKPPSWPGFAPPEACEAVAVDEAGAAASRRQCVDDADCPVDERCAAQECLKKSPGSGSSESSGSEERGSDDDSKSDSKSDSKERKNWIRLSFAPDFPMISGENVCGLADGYDKAAGPSADKYDPLDESFVCAKNPDAANPQRYLGQPTLGQGNNVNFGFGVSTMRLMLGYDRVLVGGLSLGARAGFAFGGAPYDFASFMPAHVEGRLVYTIGRHAFDGQQRVRPWVALSGGLAQFDSAVSVEVLEDGTACGATDPGSTDSPCTLESESGVEPRVQTLEAVKQAGLGFAGASVGVSFLPAELFEISLGGRFAVTFPFVVPVFSPEVGIGVGF
jgi:hypothetical protein